MFRREIGPNGLPRLLSCVHEAGDATLEKFFIFILRPLMSVDRKWTKVERYMNYDGVGDVKGRFVYRQST